MTTHSWNLRARSWSDMRSTKEKIQNMLLGIKSNNDLETIAEALIEIMDHIESVESGSDDDK